MSEQTALLNAIVAHPDDDAPRLIYADWLDEHAPDDRPTPAAGPSARAEYIRVQCRLAALPYDDPDYPELIEREQDLADWLKTHVPDEQGEPELPDQLAWFGEFDSGDDRAYRRGFPDEAYFTEFHDEPQENVAAIVAGLKEAFAASTVRSLWLEDAYGAEVAGVVADPVAAGLRGLYLSSLDEGDEDGVRAIAESPHLGGLRRLVFDVTVEDAGLRRLAKSRHLAPDELHLDFPTPDGLRALAEAKWFRRLRALQVWLDTPAAFKAVADLPPMPNLVSLGLLGGVTPSHPAVRKFAASESFPRLAKLELTHTRFAPDQLAALARAEWPLRHLRMSGVAVRKAGAAALADAAFADTLRVLELSSCDIPAGGLQALAASPRLAGLKHLNLASNPVGRGGLLALARSKSLRGLRALSLDQCHTQKAPVDAATVAGFLAAVEMPELRHLNLGGLPVGVRGGQALGGGRFANLTRLQAGNCRLRENGARAIVESAHLPNLAVLVLSDNSAGKGVTKLSAATTFPRLAIANVMSNRVPAWTVSRLRKRPGVIA
jgi:uncharacterized protein (TIGR02996 family)